LPARLLYLHLPDFPLQRRVLETPSLAGEPVALSEEVRHQRKVAFTSPAAFQTGVRNGMTIAAATALVPELRSFPHHLEEECKALSSLGEALLCLAPAFQLSPPDGLWLEASAAWLCGGEEALGLRVLEICSAQGYSGKAAAASEMFTARALARHGAPRIDISSPGQSAHLLAGLPLASLDKAGPLLEALGALGLSTLGEVASLPAGALAARMGLDGLQLHRLCRGEDDTPFSPTPISQRFEERIDLDWAAESLEPLLFALKTALDRLCARLSSRKRAAIKLSLKLKLDPSGEQKITFALARPSARVKSLLELARLHLSNLSLPSPISSLQVQVEESCEDRDHQLALGETPEGDSALETVLSRLATTLGKDALFAAEARPLHRPERAFRFKAFSPPAAERGLFKQARTDKRPPVGEAEWLARPTRLFGRPAPLHIEMDTQGVVSARLLGKRRKAQALAGPERLCGDWWEEAAYSRDYYRVHFEGLGPVWIYRDQQDGRFYLQGMFD
jgi:protein ImuB